MINSQFKPLSSYDYSARVSLAVTLRYAFAAVTCKGFCVVCWGNAISTGSVKIFGCTAPSWWLGFHGRSVGTCFHGSMYMKEAMQMPCIIIRTPAENVYALCYYSIFTFLFIIMYNNMEFCKIQMQGWMNEEREERPTRKLHEPSGRTKIMLFGCEQLAPSQECTEIYI